jgi:prepilin-type N-terminal cleavage/methylation domain-containing protein
MEGVRVHRAQHGFTLLELLIVLTVIGILASIAIPIYFEQRQKAKDSAVKEGIHTIQLGIEKWVVDQHAQYPSDGQVGKNLPASEPIGNYVQFWPKNPFSAIDMAEGTIAGDYTYTQLDGGVSYTLAGHLHNSSSFTVP